MTLNIMHRCNSKEKGMNCSSKMAVTINNECRAQFSLCITHKTMAGKMLNMTVNTGKDSL